MFFGLESYELIVQFALAHCEVKEKKLRVGVKSLLEEINEYIEGRETLPNPHRHIDGYLSTISFHVTGKWSCPCEPVFFFFF